MSSDIEWFSKCSGHNWTHSTWLEYWVFFILYFMSILAHFRLGARRQSIREKNWSKNFWFISDWTDSNSHVSTIIESSVVNKFSGDDLRFKYLKNRRLQINTIYSPIMMHVAFNYMHYGPRKHSTEQSIFYEKKKNSMSCMHASMHDQVGTTDCGRKRIQKGKNERFKQICCRGKRRR